MVDPGPATLDDYRTGFEDPSSLAKTLIVELDGEVVGDLMLAVEDAWAQTEVAPQAQGVQADLGLRRVPANCFADNIPSWRLMERVGMRRELYAVRESLHRFGEWLDTLGCALLAEEWAASTSTRD